MEIMNVLQATKLLHEQYNAEITPYALMAWIRSGNCPFGVYIKQNGKSKGMYRVFQSRINAYFNPRTLTEHERNTYFTNV